MARSNAAAPAGRMRMCCAIGPGCCGPQSCRVKEHQASRPNGSLCRNRTLSAIVWGAPTRRHCRYCFQWREHATSGKRQFAGKWVNRPRNTLIRASHGCARHSANGRRTRPRRHVGADQINRRKRLDHFAPGSFGQRQFLRLGHDWHLQRGIATTLSAQFPPSHADIEKREAEGQHRHERTASGVSSTAHCVLAYGCDIAPDNHRSAIPCCFYCVRTLGARSTRTWHHSKPVPISIDPI